jgi:GntR family transcriptional repressor for pyruvate dehydrogenase complex
LAITFLGMIIFCASVNTKNRVHLAQTFIIYCFYYVFWRLHPWSIRLYWLDQLADRLSQDLSMTHSDPIPKFTAQQIQGLILSGEFPPGSTLPGQRALAERFGVSRGSLREALTVLETLGLVHVRPGKGVYVTDPNRPTVAASSRTLGGMQAAQVYQFRLSLEPFVAGLAAQAITPAQLSDLRGAADAMRQALSSEDLVSAAQADFEFHHLLLGAAGNPLFMDAMRPVAATLQESRMLPFANRTAAWAPAAEHDAIVTQITARNPAGAHDAMHRHILAASGRAGVAFLRP